MLKKSLGIVLPKPGKKDYNDTSSYRIIALLPTLSKILERIVAFRLLPLAQASGLIHPNQCGSLPGLSTSDAVAALRHDIGTAHRRGLRASTLLLDVKGGFDNVHPSKLSQILRRAGIPRHLRAWITSFLTDRQVALIFQGGPRDFLSVFMGTPQGSPLSPLLFLIYVSGFHEERAGGVVFSYVDDFAVTVFSRSYHTNARRLERWATLLIAKAATLKLSFSLPKTDLIHWRTIQQAGPRSKDTVTMGDVTTTPSRFVRWLGFWLEDNMSTVIHFTRRLAMASAAFASVKAISHHGKGINPRACHHVAQAFIRPILLYGANLLAPTKGCLLKMGHLWHRVARWVTTCFYRLNHNILLAEAALQPLALTIRNLQVAYVARVGGTFPTLNPASARLPPDFPSPWADRSFRRVNHFEGVVGIRRPLPWRTARRYNEPRIRLPMDELAHRFLPLINTLSLVEPDRPCLPPYKRHFPPHADILSHYPAASWATLQEANTHLSWGLQLARDAPHYPYPVPSRPHRFMQLGKFQASRIHQMRSGRSYLAAQEDFLDQEPDLTCRKCGEGDETFNHAAITCPAHAQNRAALCPTVNSVMHDSPLWRSLEDLKAFGRFIFVSRINFPT